MRRGVDALRETGHDGEARGAERARELLRVARALRGCIAAADHGKRGPVEKLRTAAAIEHRGRICDLEEQLRISGVGERNEGTAGFPDPAKGALDSARDRFRIEQIGRAHV